METEQAEKLKPRTVREMLKGAPKLTFSKTTQQMMDEGDAGE